MSSWKVVHQCVHCHTHVHRGERPFSCSVCNYQCRRDCDLKRHMRRQLVRQLYQCNNCNGHFTTLQSLCDNMWSRRLCRVVKRPLQSLHNLHWYNCLLELDSIVTSHVYFTLSISEVTFDLAWLWKVRSICPRTVDAIICISWVVFTVVVVVYYGTVYNKSALYSTIVHTYSSKIASRIPWPTWQFQWT